MIKKLGLLSLLVLSNLTANQELSLSSPELRSETLTQFDTFLDWVFKQLDTSYQLTAPPVVHNFSITDKALLDFEKKFGYFSSDHPVVACTSKNPKDLEVTAHLFELIHNNITDPVQRQIAIAEALAKVLAYRDLQEGFTIKIPSMNGSHKMISYRVDKVFDLWYKMPAYGLVAEDRKSPSLLLFRGTDLSLGRTSGWASVFSDLDLSGPGFSVFTYSRTEISSWLKRVSDLGQKASVYGFSLGGIMAMYTALLESALLDAKAGMAFNPPGVNKQLLDQWKETGPKERTRIVLFLNKGDPVSKWGYLVGSAYQLMSDNIKGPIEAHNVFMSGRKKFDAYQVNVDAENKNR